MLRRLPTPTHPDLLVGVATGDDAAVWRVDEHRALVSTVDFFTPIVDDPFTWGAIAAANSVSDVYAMGARPLFALNIAAWPRDVLPFDLLADALAGAASVAAEGGWVIAGGHSVDGPEPMLGQAITGEVATDAILTNDSGRAGDLLVLTKALGTGVITTAVKRSAASETVGDGYLVSALGAAVASMRRLNASASLVAARNGVRCMTDVTGFGLAGHLHKLVLASGLEAVVETTALPLLPDVDLLLESGFVPGGTSRNLEFLGTHLIVTSTRRNAEAILGDPQTSGGLLMCVPAQRLADIQAELIAGGDLGVVVGELRTGVAGRVSLR